LIQHARPLLVDVAAGLLHASGVTQSRRRQEGDLTIATFHRVLPGPLRDQYPLPGIVVTPDELEWFLRFFTRHFTCGTLCDVRAAWESGERPKRPLLAVTFDDAQRDNFDHARPILDRVGVRASFFAPLEALDDGRALWHDRIGYAARRVLGQGGRSGREALAAFGVEPGAEEPPDATARRLIAAVKELPPEERLHCVVRLEELVGGDARPQWDGLMTWAQIEALAEQGHEIGSHSMTHSLLPQCSDDELEYEVGESKRVLESRLGVEAESFCYPNGDCDARTIDAVRRAGYRQAVTTRWGSNAPGCDPFTLRRCDMDASHVADRRGAMSAARLAWRLSGWYPGLG
jgi:peptidoglycan/xylan/chitin deacetylase (PgdA/CDA1 family)